MYLVTGCSASLLSDSGSAQKKKKNQKQKKMKYQKCNFFKTSRNVLPPSRPGRWGYPVDLTGPESGLHSSASYRTASRHDGYLPEPRHPDFAMFLAADDDVSRVVSRVHRDLIWKTILNG